MAKKKTKKKAAKKAPKAITSPRIISGTEVAITSLQSEVALLRDQLVLLEQRFSKLITALDKSKSVRGI